MKQQQTLNKLFIFIIFLFSANGFGQELYDHDLDENKLQDLKSNIRHLSQEPQRWTYDSEKEYTEALEKYQKQNSEDGDVKNGNGKGNSIKEKGYESPEASRSQQSDTNLDFDMPNLNLGPVGTVILYIVLGGILAVLVYFLFISSAYKKNGKTYTPLDLEETAPADIPKTELERLLEEAIRNKHYRKAIRIYYLFILKDLSEREWIQWEKQKTNMHYVLEMQSKKEGKAFNTVVTYFEFIWYGKRDISEHQFKRVQSNFLELLKSLNIK